MKPHGTMNRSVLFVLIIWAVCCHGRPRSKRQFLPIPYGGPMMTPWDASNLMSWFNSPAYQGFFGIPQAGGFFLPGAAGLGGGMWGPGGMLGGGMLGGGMLGGGMWGPGGMFGGGMFGGGMPGGGIPGGGMPGGEMSSDGTSSGEMSSGEMSSGEMASGGTSSDV